MYKILTIFLSTTILILIITSSSFATWQINVEISTPDTDSDTGIASNKLYLGTDPAAADGYDNNLDTIALLDGPIQAYFPHPEYPTNQQKLWRDFRKDSLPKEWEIEVTTIEMNSPVKINWEINVPEKLNLTLIEKESNKEIDMTSYSDYTYNNNSILPKKFLLKVTGEVSGETSRKGGGCGYIKNTRQRGNPMNEYGQIAINFIILIAPLLITLQHYARKRAFVVVKRK